MSGATPIGKNMKNKNVQSVKEELGKKHSVIPHVTMWSVYM